MKNMAFAQALRETRLRLKLSQLELASRAGTSQRYVSFIERGRSIPGRDVVIRLAAALELPLRQRNQLLLDAGFAPIYPHTEIDAPRMRPVRGALTHLLRAHLPCPAVVIDRCGDIIAANTACEILTEGTSPVLRHPPVNLYRLALHPEGLAPRIHNLAEWSQRIRDRLRAEARRVPEPRLTDLLADLDTYADAYSVPIDRALHQPYEDLGYAVPLHLQTSLGDLQLITTITVFGAATDITLAELRLEAFLPADEVTERILHGGPAGGGVTFLDHVPTAATVDLASTRRGPALSRASR